MKAIGRVAALGTSALASAIVCAAPIHADAGGVSCHAINTKGAGQDLGGGMTQAQIMGGGLLQGTTQGSFLSPASRAPSRRSPGRWSSR